MAECDVVFRGARTIDPETQTDAVCDVAVTGDRITAVAAGGDPSLVAKRDIDVAGLVLAPGFIDLHSHCRDYPSRALQVCDGVTTALELEEGALGVAQELDAVALEGSPNHYGFSASWALARMAACGLDVDAVDDPFMEYIGRSEWHRALDGPQNGRMLDALRSDLGAGGIGVGILLGYCAEASSDEYLSLASLAAAQGTATFTHVRELSRADSGYFGASEVVSAALATGAHMHLCHVNSTSLRTIDAVHELIGRAHSQGLRVTAEAYPYGAGCTAVGAAFLAPEALGYQGLDPTDIRYLPTGEVVASAARLAELRASDPAGLVVVDFLRETDPTDLGFLTRALLADDTAIASDAMPLVPPPALVPRGPGGTEWPVAPGTLTHPRTAGTFSRVLRWYVRELGVLDLPEAIRRATLVPADVLADVAPQMRRKGRVQVGADADLVVLDPHQVTDRATYAEPTRTSTGINHVMVAGELVVHDATLQTSVRPGRPIRGGSA
jgi:hypothetical protein